MTKKRFIDGGEECIEDQFFIDTKNDTNYWIDNGLEDIIDLLNELNDENEQLKQSRAEMLRELRIYRMIASCNNCEYQNYDWFDDGDEFEVCEKGNTDQQIEYHICKEWREI